MVDEKTNGMKNKKWHQRWWGVFFLLIFVMAFIYIGALLYQVVYYVDAQSSLKNLSKVPLGSSVNIRDFVEKQDAPFAGNPKGSVVIVEFGDFQCPYCKAEAPILKRLISEESSVKLIFRNFPNPVAHAQALESALAAQCANEQGKFWEYHDQLFANQDDLSDTNLKSLAQNLGLSTDQFNTCLDNSKYFSVIQSDMQDGLSLNISATPTFYINGTKVVGNIPYDTFEQIIQGILRLNAQNTNINTATTK